MPLPKAEKQAIPRLEELRNRRAGILPAKEPAERDKNNDAQR